MRALIISDVHANLDALEAVLEAAPPHDTVWNLGDSVGYGASPNEVIERVRDLGAVFVRGNHDRACCGLMSLDDFNPIASRAAQWTQSILTEEHTAWLLALAHGPVRPNGPTVSVMHGSPVDEDEYLLSMRDAWEPLQTTTARINFFGHTHLQGGFATDGERIFKVNAFYSTRNGAEECEIELRESAKYLINPGSVGQPRDNDWRAACGIYDDEKMTISFLRIPYDVRAAQMKIIRAGLPDRLAFRLREGR
ncbi:metallophosphoesterase family protein [Acidisarcina polymorpha]|uniref:metallophosphoesterase family protein n=1 Tax=Acidisarcina polymorpha TaxID=2211140 RepID=UPI000DEEF1A1|nr:metallophosphoesterase family protein [Acidisarcina polymorpha]